MTDSSGRVALLTTADAGATWADQGVPVPLAVNGSVVLVADNASGQLHRRGKAVDTQGLPVGVTRMTLAGQSAGWALASHGSCARGKQSCSIRYTLVATGNSGDTWHHLLTWQEKLG